MHRPIKIYVKILFFITLVTVFNQAFSAPARNTPKTLPYFAGFDALFSRRTGSYTFEHLDTRQDSAKKMLFLSGFNLGKRYYAASWLRFEAEGMFHFGSIVEDTFYVPGEFSSKYGYRQLCFHLNIQLVRPLLQMIDWFVFCGSGINYMHVVEKTVLPEDHKQAVTVDGYSGLDLKQWSPNLGLGTGFDFKLSKFLGIGISYTYRLGQPVRYLEGRNMPLDAIEYRETFHTHMIQVKLLTGFGGE